jgi:hypothetical protein
VNAVTSRAITVKVLRTVATFLGLAVTACAGLPETPEAMMSDSGFKAMPVKTAAQVASFNSLPKQQVTKKIYKGKTIWVYPADPTICTCLYVGDQQAYDT